MNVGQLKELLSQFRDDLEVMITDGHECVTYRGDFDVVEYTDFDGTKSVDIGVGGFDDA